MTRRGPEPSDPRHFRQDVVPTLRTATADLSWLLGRGYAEQAALKLVGDRFQLAKRQRHAVVRAACTDAERDQRAENRLYRRRLRAERELHDVLESRRRARR